MTVIVSTAATAAFLLGLGAGLLFMLPFDKLIVNTFARGILVSLIALVPMGLGAAAVGSIANSIALDRNLLGLAYFVGIMVGAIWDRVRETRRRG
jgi:hypothetical protein